MTRAVVNTQDSLQFRTVWLTRPGTPAGGSDSQGESECPIVEERYDGCVAEPFC